jgi:hypothetical protein
MKGAAPFPGEEEPLGRRSRSGWGNLACAAHVGEISHTLLTSAGIYLTPSQPTFDLEREQTHPDWGDPTWRAIPASSHSHGHLACGKPC